MDIKGIFYTNFETSYIPEILTEIYRDKIYDVFMKNKDLTILDLGANIGLTTQYFAQYAKKVYSVEPAQKHIDVLKHMVKYNKLDNVEVLRYAIANEDKELTLHHNPNETMFSLKEAVADKSLPSEKVEGIRINTLMKKHNIEHVDFMKLDIEGAEMEVVGGRGFEKACENIDALVVEYHNWSGWNPGQLYTTLKDYGYEVKQIPSNATLFGAIKK